MLFDPLSWALGLSLTKTTTWLASRAFSDDLPKQLRKVVKDWSKDVPVDIHPNTLFKVIHTDHLSGKLPGLRELRNVLRENQIPSKSKWLEALLERWHTIRDTTSRAQPFFQLSESEATHHLYQLASAIHRVCVQDEQLYRGDTYKRLQEIESNLRENKSSSIPIINWRPLDLLTYIASPKFPSLNKGFPAILCYHLYEIYSDDEYKSFIGLLRGEKKVIGEIGETSVFYLVTSEPQYTGTIRQTIGALMDTGLPRRDREVLQQKINERLSMLASSWNSDYNLEIDPYWRAHSFVFDPDSKSINVFALDKNDLPSDTWEVETTGDLFRLAAYFSGDRIALWPSFDKLAQKPLLLKVALDLLDSGEIALEHVRIDSNDGETWDYIS